jgi:hypothetical protein
MHPSNLTQCNAMKRRSIRLAMLSLYHSRYEPVTCATPNRCFYCGAIATQMDHCPSLGTSSTLGDGWRRVQHYLIPSCGPCNGMLSDRPLLTPCARASYIATKLEREFNRYSALWTDEEIAEMGQSFVESLKARDKVMREMLRRIHHLQVCALRGDEWAYRWSDAL